MNSLGSNNQSIFGNNISSNNQQNSGFNGSNNSNSSFQPKFAFNSPATTQNLIFGSNTNKTEPSFGTTNQFNSPSMTTNNPSNNIFGNNTNQSTNMFSNTTPSTFPPSTFSNNTNTNLFGNSNQNTFNLNQGPSNAKSAPVFGTGSNTASTGFSFNTATASTATSNNLFGNQAKVPNFSSPISTANPTTGFNFDVNSAASSNNISSGFQAPPINATNPISNNSTPNMFGNNSMGFQLNTTQNTTPNTNSFAANNSANTAFSTSISNPFGTPTATGTTGVNFGSSAPVTNSLTNIAPVAQANTQNASTAFPSFQSTFTTTTPSSYPIGLNNNTVNTSTAVSAAPTSFTMNQTASSFSLNPTTTSSAAGPFQNLNLASSTAAPQQGFGLINTGLGGISTSKLLPNNASPLAVNSVSAKKGLGGSPISDTLKPALSKDASQKSCIVKQVKDSELQPEIRETIEPFTKFVAEQKKLREEIIKSNDVTSLMLRVEEESQTLRQSISEVANGLQKIQIQGTKLKSDITKEQSSIKIAQTSSDTSMSMSIDRNDSTNYFSGKVRDLENRAGLYLQEIEAVESLCQSPHKSALTTRDLVDIIRKMDDEFIGLAANLYMVHERVKSAKTEVLRRSKQMNNHHNPFAAIEGRFGETFASIGGSAGNQRQLNASRRAPPKASDTVGGSPFDSSCYMNQMASLSFPKPANTGFPKPSFFGSSGVGIGTNSNNNNQPLFLSPAMTSASPFSANNTTSFALNKPTSLFLTDTVSNKKRR